MNFVDRIADEMNDIGFLAPGVINDMRLRNYIRMTLRDFAQQVIRPAGRLHGDLSDASLELIDGRKEGG